MAKVHARHLIVIAVLVFCAMNSIAQEKYFPPNAFAADRGGDQFVSGWFSDQLRALKEPSLFELAHNSSAQSYRFLWLRTFNHPVAIRLDVMPDGSATLTTKVTSGAGGYKPGKLITNSTKTLTKGEVEKVISRIRQANLWSMPGYVVSGGDDGAEWIIEEVSHGTYHVIKRWSPEQGPVHELGMMFLFDLAHLTIPKNEIY